MFDVAVDLLRRCPRLAMRNQGQGAGDNLLLTLAKAPSSSLDQIQLPSWKRWLYERIHVHLAHEFALDEVVNLVAEVNDSIRDNYARSAGSDVTLDLVRDWTKLAMRDQGAGDKSQFPSWKRWLYERLLLGLVGNIDNLLGIQQELRKYAKQS
ncbi:hypothetical protein S83_067337 [Arachis hypogaea]